MTTASKTPPPPVLPPSRPPVQPRRPPNKPDCPPIDPPSKGLAADLDHAELLLRLVQLLTADRFAGLDPALLHQLKTGLRTARIAIDGAKTPARPHLSSAAAVAGGPVQTSRLQTGERLTPGSVAAFSGAATESAGSCHSSAGAISGPGGKAASAASGPDRAGGPPAPGADLRLPEPRPWPGRPFPVYEVPTP